MIKIVESTNRRRWRRCSAPERDARRGDRAARRADRRRRAARRRRARCSATRASSTGSTGPIEVSRDEMRAAAATVPTRVRARDPRRGAATSARSPGGRCRAAGACASAPGVTVEQRVVPLDRVGCYVPGGRYPLPSSLLMTAIPATAAGVGEVVAVCPRPEPVVMAAALEAGVSRLFRIGGAHAVAALAYGTASVPRVDKIVGPGNRYVAAAKALVAADCGIDFYAGPTEIVIVAATRSG